MRANFLHKESIAFEDFGIANLQMVNGSVGTLNYTINAVEKNMEGSLTLFGEKGTVKIGGQYLNELEYFSVTDVPLPHLQKGNPANEYGFYTGSMSNHDKVYDNLIKTLADPAHPFINMSDILKVTTMIESIYENSPFIK